ncbi:hypothetical protein ARMSODRAFT_1065526 [Armillaria solidipes]|uniref:Uncharacterized protein n=1 Tax=Armillaria solidipes TaxID=1076256 RepID=A0A2H3AQL5_9AGAR|nr:hypothetical protein ARMSODRAFT_1065526 [Armillaria solidipes]
MRRDRMRDGSYTWSKSTLFDALSLIYQPAGYWCNPWVSELNSCSTLSPPFLQPSSPKYPLDVELFDVIFGKRIRPHDRAMVSHWEEHDGCETLITAVFPGPLNPTTEVRVREDCMYSLNNWTALDYDEDLGMIALRSGFGKVTIIQL